MYSVHLESISSKNIKCLSSLNEKDSWLWHRRLAHVSMDLISKLAKKNLVSGLPNLTFEKDNAACQKGKQTKISFKPKNVMSTSRSLQLLHMDLFGLTRTLSLGGKCYGFVVVNDFSRSTWALFLAHKDEAFHAFKKT